MIQNFLNLKKQLIYDHPSHSSESANRRTHIYITDEGIKPVTLSEKDVKCLLVFKRCWAQ